MTSIAFMSHKTILRPPATIYDDLPRGRWGGGEGECSPTCDDVLSLGVPQELPEQLLVSVGGVAREADPRPAGDLRQIAVHHGLIRVGVSWVHLRVMGSLACHGFT